MRINTNIFSMMTQHRLQATTKAIGRSLERLGSGNRINSARDDAAGLAISSNIESSTRATARAIQNLSEANGMLQVADGALATQIEIVQRMRELALQSANGALGSNERAYLQTEFAQLMEEFDRIATSTDFFGTHLLDGSFNTVSLMVGSNANDTIEFSISSSRSSEMFGHPVQSGDYARVDNYLTGTSDSVAQVLEADINEDGFEDLVFSDTAGNAKIQLSDGEGGLGTASTLFTDAGGLGTLQIKDVDNDGHLDIYSGKAMKLYVGDGEGNFSLEGAYTTGAGGAAQAARLGDLNDDGYQDLVYGYLSGTGKVAVRYGNGTGFGSETILYNNGSGSALSNPATIRLTDIDGDGRLDIHASGSNAAARYVVHNNGDGTFTTTTTTIRYNGEFYDFNGDGYEDHLGTSLSIATIGFNNQAGGYSAAVGISLAPAEYVVPTCTVLDVRDADGDGDLDLIANITDADIGSTNPSLIAIALNDGHGTFTLSQTVLAENSSMASFIDLDGEDNLEFVTNAYETDPNIAVYKKGYNSEVVSIATQEGAQDALEVLSDALSSISANRANIGAVTNRLEFASSALGLQRESLLGAKSRILDADIAQETSELVRLQVLQQAQVAVLGQNNLSSRAVLKLLENI